MGTAIPKHFNETESMVSRALASKIGAITITILVLCVATGVLPVAIPFPFGMLACAFLALALMRLQNENLFATILLPFFRRLPIAIFTAATLIAIDIIVLNGDIFHTLTLHLFSPARTDPDVHQFVFKRLDDLLNMIGMAWLSAAVGEEIVFRMFLLEQIEKIAGNGPLAKVVACVCSAVVFGFGHAYQGSIGIFGTSLVGLTFCVAYYLSGKNIVALILAHGIIDTYWLIHLYTPN